MKNNRPSPALRYKHVSLYWYYQIYRKLSSHLVKRSMGSNWHNSTKYVCLAIPYIHVNLKLKKNQSTDSKKIQTYISGILIPLSLAIFL